MVGIFGCDVTRGQCVGRLYGNVDRCMAGCGSNTTRLVSIDGDRLGIHAMLMIVSQGPGMAEVASDDSHRRISRLHCRTSDWRIRL